MDSKTIDELLENAKTNIELQRDTNNYICRNKNELPQRDSDIYTEIDDFAEHELTYCIAYEMAIRNQEINQKIEEYLSKNNIIRSTDAKYKELKKFGFSHSSLAYYHTCKSGMMKVLKMMEDQNLLKNIYHQDALIVKDEVIKEKKDEEFITIEKTSIPHIISTSEALYSVSADGTLNEITQENISSDYLPNIEYELARPKLKFKESKLFNVELNLNFSEHEQIKYIEKLVETYKNKSSSIKTYDDYFRSIDLSNAELPNGQKKPKAKKYADWFYAYDYYMVAKQISNDNDNSILDDIKIELGFFYETKEDVYSPVTFRKTIIPTMKKLIDEKEYKYLITGLK